jgi:hypothetical protein
LQVFGHRFEGGIEAEGSFLCLGVSHLEDFNGKFAGLDEEVAESFLTSSMENTVLDVLAQSLRSKKLNIFVCSRRIGSQMPCESLNNGSMCLNFIFYRLGLIYRRNSLTHFHKII